MSEVETLSVYVIFEGASDYPQARYVVRRQKVLAGVIDFDPTPIYVGDSLADARAALPYGLAMFARSPDDDPVILECWL